MGIPAPRGVGEFGGVMLGRSSVDPAPGISTDPKRRFLGRSRYAIAVGSYTPAQGDGRGLPRPRQIPSPPGGPWTCTDQTVSYNKFLNLINFMERIYLFSKETNDQKGKEGLIVKVIKRKF